MVMKKINAFFLMCVISGLNAEWDAQVSYSIKLPERSEWGVGSISAVNNNGGKAGIITGVVQDIIMCPSMPFGVKPWVATTVKSFACDQERKAALDLIQASGLKNATRCEGIKSQIGQSVDFTALFSNVKSFAQTLEQDAQRLVETFPDISQGEGYASTAYLAACKSPSFALSKQLALVTRIIQGVLIFDVSVYFVNNQFLLTFDMTEPTPSEQDVANAKNWFLTAVQLMSAPDRQVAAIKKTELLLW